jgi:hypothetical protein
VTALRVPDLHFHDLRHTGNTLAAQTRANLRDLMTRIGHDGPRAALIYQHASSDADRAIADALGRMLAEREEGKSIADADGEGSDDGDDGAAGVLVRVS